MLDIAVATTSVTEAVAGLVVVAVIVVLCKHTCGSGRCQSCDNGQFCVNALVTCCCY